MGNGYTKVLNINVFSSLMTAKVDKYHNWHQFILINWWYIKQNFKKWNWHKTWSLLFWEAVFSLLYFEFVIKIVHAGWSIFK